ncbi:hypothetical protein BGZ57DRAFT_433840 [Hyaloscypha finlandica]|nr:hypothetical protein BGZ57DRAFT_433840 [Hyaloscypha finlandica]
MDEVLPGSEKATSSTSGPVTRPSRRARNDQKWDSLQDEIRHIYMTDDFTLQNTKRVIEDKHGFKASERKWKEKLKEWKFDKNISATDMSVLVAIAGKRMRDEGKRTIFFLGESQITRDRIEQFKRRKLTREIDDVSAEADTPKNITYHTPPRDSPEPERNNPTVSKRDGGFPSWYPYPGNRISSDFKTSEGKDTLSTVLELPFESESSENGSSNLETHQTYDSSEMDDMDDSALSQDSASINEPDRLLGHELAAQMDRVISRMIESSSLRAKHPGVVSSLSSSHVQRPNNGLEYLSTGVPKGLPLHMSVSNIGGIHARNSEPLEESEIETPHYFMEKELDHPFLADRILPVLGTNDSNESEDSVSESESSTVSERDMQALSARSRLYFHQKQKALELRANGRSMAGIFEHLVADSDETGLEFCQNMIGTRSSRL